MSNQDGMSEEFELLDVSHDVLSMSDTETSDGYENDLRTAAAIIEALEDAPHGSLQGFDLGSIPLFVGGLYGTSPPAAGQTFTVDLGTSPVSSSGALNAQRSVPAAVAPEVQPEQPAAATTEMSPTVQVVSPDNGREDGTAAVKGPDMEPEADSTPDADSTEAPDASIDGASAFNDRAPALNSAVLVCLFSAAALATVLLLLSAAAGSYHPIDSQGHAYVTTSPRLLHQSTFRSTFTSPYSYDADTRMDQINMLTGMATAAAASGLPAATANAGVGAGDLGSLAAQGLPWWLAFNSTSAGRRQAQGRYMKLASLPPSLQLVAEGSARADMSPSQRLRLHLWLLHCAARDTTQQQTQPKVSGPATTTPYVPFQPFASVKHTRLASPIPVGLQCAASETALGWLSGFRPAPPQNPTQPAARLAAAQPPSGTNHTDPAISAVDTLLRFITPFAVSSSSSGGRYHPGSRSSSSSRLNLSSSSSCSNSGYFAAAALCCSHQPAANTPQSGFSTAPHSPPAADLPTPSPYHPHCSNDPSTAVTHTHTVGRRIAPPTKPVPPLHRPPLPCLLLGGRRPNRTAFRALSTAQHSTTSSPRSRASTWPNVTTRHHQGLATRAVGARGGKPYGRALAISLMRWGLHQQAMGGAVGAAAGVTLPMLPPIRQTRVVANGTGSSTGSGHRKDESEGAAVPSPLTLPMLPPVWEPPVAASVQQQEEPQEERHTPFTSTISTTSSSSSSSSAQFNGLTLPMLPPVEVCRDDMQNSIHCVTHRPLLPPGPTDSHSTAIHTAQSSSKATPTRRAAAGVELAAEVLTVASTHYNQQQPSSSPGSGSIVPVWQQQDGQGSWQQLLSSSSSTAEGSTETCSAGGNASQGFILFHSLVPPTAAAAAAESAALATKRAQEFSRQRGDAADSVAVIKQQVDITWQYDYYDYETCYKYMAGAMTVDDLYAPQQQRYHFDEAFVDADNENDVICVDDDMEYLEGAAASSALVSCSAISLMAGGASSSCTGVMDGQAGAAAIPLPPAASKATAAAAAIPLPPVEAAAAAAAIPLPPVQTAEAAAIPLPPVVAEAAGAAIPLPPVQATAAAAAAAAIPLPPVQSSAAAVATNDIDLAAPAAAAKAAAAHKCINNATWACAVTAAAQLAATAGVQQPPLALAGPVVKQAAVRKAVNATDAACRAFKLIAGFPGVDMAAVVPHSSKDKGATAWIASLVTLPMLPPTTSETKAAAAARESRLRRDVGATQLAVVDGTAGHLSFFGPRVSCDVINVSSNRRRQLLWPGQAI